MATPRRASRVIVVDGDRYRWRLRRRPLDRAQLEALARDRPPSELNRLRLTSDCRSGIEIDGVDLLDLVRVAERPHVQRELDSGASTSDYAGEYLGFGAKHFALPSRELLGEYDTTQGFAIPVNHPGRGKTTLLGCTCGIIECWFLLARITLLDDFVVWSDFEQFHRHWVYDLGPFVFDRARYLEALAPGTTSE